MRLPALVLAFAFAGGAVHAAAGADSALADRIDRIQRLLEDVRVELDSLRGESRALAARPEGPILGELLTDRQRALAKASRTDFRTLAAGYSFNWDLPMGLNLMGWRDPWGLRLGAGAIITDNTRLAGADASILYSIHRFLALDLMETHLYALAGAGYLHERPREENRIGQPWYGTPDRRVSGLLGVGTEFSFFGLGGIRFAPETGLRAERFLSRYQDSEGYAGASPESDFDLGPFFAFHLNFYFR